MHVFLCKLLPFLAYLSMGASVLTLTAITIDLYLVIVRPMRRPLSKQLTMVPILLKWLISNAIFAAELYKFRLFKDSGQVACAPSGGLRITCTTTQDYQVRDGHSVRVVILASAAN